MNSKIISISAASLLALSGCSAINSPKLYGNNSCGSNKTAYVYTSGNAAICLNEASVAYMVCARELGVLTTEVNSTRKANISANAIDKATAEGSIDSTGKVSKSFASDGVIAEATAKAIETCIKIHDTYL